MFTATGMIANAAVSKCSIKKHINKFTGDNIEDVVNAKMSLLKCVDELDDDFNKELCGVCMVESCNLLKCYIGCSFSTCLKCYHKLNEKKCPACTQGFDEYFYRESEVEFQGLMIDRLPNDKEGALYYLPNNVFSFHGPVKNGQIDGPGEVEFDNNVYGSDISFVDWKINGFVKTYIENPEDEGLLELFEGEYVNGEMLKGILYNSIRQRYEGQFKNGQYDGYGLMKDSEGKVMYCGYWKSGKKNGTGLDYNKQEELMYCGGYNMGNREGHGKLYRDNSDPTKNLKFKGRFENDSPVDGYFYTLDGEIQNLNKYEGNYILSISSGVVVFKGKMNNILEMNGECCKYSNKGSVIFIGQYCARNKRGTGTEYCSETSEKIYCGQFLYGVRDGNGQLFDKSKLVYSGKFIGGKFGGKGKFFWNCGVVCNAIFSKGNPINTISLYMPQEILLVANSKGLVIGAYNKTHIRHFNFKFTMHPDEDLTQLEFELSEFLGEGDIEEGEVLEHFTRNTELQPFLLHPSVFGSIGSSFM